MKDSEWLTTVGLLDRGSRFWEELPSSKKEKDGLEEENEVVLSLRMELFDLNKTGRFNEGSLLELKTHVVETEVDLKKALKTTAVSGSGEKMSKDKVSSLAEETSLVRVERSNLRVDLDGRTSLVRRMRENAGKELSTEST